METIKTIILDNGKKVEFYQSEGDSRSWDNMTTMICFHGNYNLGDKHDYNSNDYSSFEEMKADIVKKENVAVIKPLYLYDHSGITIATTPFGCRWDSGQVGYAIITKETIRKEYGAKRVSRKIIKKAEAILQGEVETYDKDLTGDVYGFSCYDENGEVSDSCGGFYGSKFEENGMLEYICDDDIKAELSKHGGIF